MTEQNKYLKELWRQIFLPKSKKKSVFKSFEGKIRDYCDQNPSATYEDLVKEFGEPEELVMVYMDSLDMTEIAAAFRNRKKLRIIMIIILLLAAVAVVSIFAFETFSKMQNGYFVEQIVDYGDVSSSPVVEKYEF